MSKRPCACPRDLDRWRCQGWPQLRADDEGRACGLREVLDRTGDDKADEISMALLRQAQA